MLHNQKNGLFLIAWDFKVSNDFLNIYCASRRKYQESQVLHFVGFLHFSLDFFLFWAKHCPQSLLTTLAFLSLGSFFLWLSYLF